MRKFFFFFFFSFRGPRDREAEKPERGGGGGWGFRSCQKKPQKIPQKNGEGIGMRLTNTTANFPQLSVYGDLIHSLNNFTMMITSKSLIIIL